MASELNISMQTLHQENTESKAKLMNDVKEHPIIKKILNDLVEANIVDIIKKDKE